MSALAVGCGRSAAVQTTSSLPLHRVVVYRNGVGYFERQGHVAESEVNFHVLQREVGDFLATLAVMERGGSSVRAAAFPLPEERANGEAPRPELRRTVRLALDGREHDLAVGYTVETPIWRPSYRLVFANNNAEVQAWGIVQNLSGEDWTNVSLSLVAGSPVSFRSELATPVIPTRPVVTDEGSVIDAVPTSETTLAQGGEGQAPAPTTGAAPEPEPDDNTNGVVDEIQQQVDVSGLRARNSRGPVGRAAGASAQREQRAFSDLPPAPPRTTTPRNVAALAAVAVQGGATRYDLPQRVTIPDRSATMVMLAAREVPGRQMFLYAPDPGIAASAWPDSRTAPARCSSAAPSPSSKRARTSARAWSTRSPTAPPPPSPSPWSARSPSSRRPPARWRGRGSSRCSAASSRSNASASPAPPTGRATATPPPHA
jgi:hypothetical protein